MKKIFSFFVVLFFATSINAQISLSVTSLTNRTVQRGHSISHQITLRNGDRPLPNQTIQIDDPITAVCTWVTTNQNGQALYNITVPNSTASLCYNFRFMYGNNAVYSTVSVIEAGLIPLNSYQVSLNSATSINNNTLAVSGRRAPAGQTISNTMVAAKNFGIAVVDDYLSNPVNQAVAVGTIAACAATVVVPPAGGVCMIGIKTVASGIAKQTVENGAEIMIDKSKLSQSRKDELKTIVRSGLTVWELASFQVDKGINGLSQTADFLKFVNSAGEMTIDLLSAANNGQKVVFVVRKAGTNEVMCMAGYKIPTNLTVSPTSHSNVSAAGVNNLVSQVTTNANSWSVQSLSQWITVTKLNNSFRMSVQSNTGTAPRTGTVRVTAGNLVRDVTVTQLGATATCNTPSGLSCPAKTKNSMTLQWSSVAGAVSYSLNIKASFMTSWSEYGPTSSLGGVINNLTPGYTYNVRVRANCSNGSSAWSGIINVTLPTTMDNPGNDSNQAVAETRESYVILTQENEQEDTAFELVTNVYPNPTNGLFTVEFNTQSAEKITIQILDIQGRVISEKQVTGDTEQEMFDLSHEPNGLYFVKTIQGNIVKVNKIMLIKQ